MKPLLFFLASLLALGQSSQVHYDPAAGAPFPVARKFTIANSSTNFLITDVLTGSTTTVAKSAAVTQSVIITTLPANTLIQSCFVKSATAFTGTTTLTATVGITGSLTACIATPFDLKAAVSATNFSAATPTVPVVSTASVAAVLALTSTIDNLSSISAGSVTVELVYLVLP